MLKILGIILALGIAFVIVKYIFSFAIRLFVFAIVGFLIVGAISGFLTLIDVLSSDSAWVLTWIATGIGAAVGLYQLLSSPSEFITDVKEIYHTDNTPPSYDTEGYEINHYPNKRCCGNCRHNMSRSPNSFDTIYCGYNSFYHNELSYHQDDSCKHWERFR